MITTGRTVLTRLVIRSLSFELLLACVSFVGASILRSTLTIKKCSGNITYALLDFPGSPLCGQLGDKTH